MSPAPRSQRWILNLVQFSWSSSKLCKIPENYSVQQWIYSTRREPLENCKHLLAVSRMKKTHGLDVDQITYNNDDDFLWWCWQWLWLFMVISTMMMTFYCDINSDFNFFMVMLTMIMTMIMITMMTLIIGWLSTVPAQVISGRSLDEWCSLSKY